MNGATPRELPAALFLALIAVTWLGVGVASTTFLALVDVLPHRYNLATILHQASPLLLCGWGAMAPMAIGALLTRGRQPHACLAFLSIFLVGYIMLAPAIYQQRNVAFWAACGTLVLVAIGAWQLDRRKRHPPSHAASSDK